jgi:hypothetical protein
MCYAVFVSSVNELIFLLVVFEHDFTFLVLNFYVILRHAKTMQEWVGSFGEDKFYARV